jgi:hypothetical protein
LICLEIKTFAEISKVWDSKLYMFIKKKPIDPYACANFKSIAIIVPEIITNLLAEDTWRKSSFNQTFWSIRKLQMVLEVKKIFNYLLDRFRIYSVLKTN